MIDAGIAIPATEVFMVPKEAFVSAKPEELRVLTDVHMYVNQMTQMQADLLRDSVTLRVIYQTPSITRVKEVNP